MDKEIITWHILAAIGWGVFYLAILPLAMRFI